MAIIVVVAALSSPTLPVHNTMTDRKARLAALAAKAGRAPKTAAAVEEEPAPKKAKVDDDSQSALQRAVLQAQAPATEHAAAPKKINWDLKRDIQPKLDKLEKRTQKAIVELLKARLEQEATEDLD